MPRIDSPTQPPIAVVGVGAIMPGSTDAAGFWNSIVTGEDLITDVPRTHWLAEDYYDPDPTAVDKTYVRRGSFLPLIDFDPMEFGIPPSVIPATDTAQLFALQVADQTLRDALRDGYDTVDRDRFGIILGSGNLELLSEIFVRLGRPIWARSLRELGFSARDADGICDHMIKDYPQWQEATLPGGLGNIVAGRVANRLDLQAVNYTVDAACASSLAAVSAAVNELVLGRADMMITGGVDALNNPCTFVSFCKTPALSPTQDCRPFSAAADGTLLGEGVAMVALKRLADAERDDDRIYAVIRGIGASSDGRGSAIYAPTPEGQVRALRAAYADAGYGPDTVELLEAHGTGTVMGDRTEVTALTEVFGAAGRPDRRWCALGSVKSQIGHTKSAAGAAGLVKTVLALHHHTLPPTIKVAEPNADLRLDSSPFYLNTAGRPWVRPPDYPRRASVSSFGFGGINYHVALEEAPARATAPSAAPIAALSAAPSPAPSPPPGAAPSAAPASGSASTLAATGSELIMFSAETPEEIIAALGRIDPARGIAELARTTQQDFDHTRPARLAIVAADPEDLAAKLDQAASLIGQRRGEDFTNPRGLHYAVGPPPAAGGDPGQAVGLLFPGQGSQYVGMGTDVALRYPAAQAVWDRFGAGRFDGTTLRQVVFPSPAFTAAQAADQQATLTAAEWAQPALALHSLALLAVLTEYGVRPRCVAGHSFGELTALCAAGVLDAEALVAVARHRGELLRRTAQVSPGRMLAVAAGRDTAASALERAGVTDVWVTNHNAPAQVVLSGTAEGLAAVAGALDAEGISTGWLETATAFHSPLVAGAREPLRDFLRDVEIHPPRIDVYANADGHPYPADPDRVRDQIVEQLTTPVAFVDEIEAMYADGVRIFVEVGPGARLIGLVNQILDGRDHLAISLDRRGRDGDAAVQSALGQLAVQGLDLDLPRRGETGPTTPRRKPVMTMKIDGANYGRGWRPPDDSPAPSDNGQRNHVAHADAPASTAAPASTGTLPDPAPAAAEPMPPPASASASPAPTASPASSPEPPPAAVSAVPPAAQPTPPSASPPSPSSAAPAAVSAPTAVSSPTAVSAPSAPPPPEPGGWFAPPAVDPASALPAPVVGPTSVVGPPGSADARGDWWQAVAQTHRQTAAAHTAYQQLMTQAHLEFLRASGAACVWLVGGTVQDVGGAVARAPGPDGAALAADPPPPRPIAPPTPTAEVSAGAPTATGPDAGAPAAVDEPIRTDAAAGPPPAAPTQPALTQPAPTQPDMGQPDVGQPAPIRPDLTQPDLTPLVPPPITSPAAGMPVAAGAAPADAPAGGPAPVDVAEMEKLLLSVVAERTGYPVSVLAMDMELEGDLGIDSLKKVEILSALRQRVGDVAIDVTETDNIAELANLRTLGEVVDLMRRRLGPPSADDDAAGPEASEAGGAPFRTDTTDITDTADSTGALDSSGERAGDSAAADVQPRLNRVVPAFVPVSAPGLAMCGLGRGPLTIVDGGSGVASALVDRLVREGVEAAVDGDGGLPPDCGGIVLLGGLADLGGRADCPATGGDATATGGDATGGDATSGDATGGGAGGTVERALDAQREAFRWAHAVAASDVPRGGLFVTVQDTGGDLGLDGRAGDRAWLGGLAALAGTAAQEWPAVTVKAIDCERGGRGPAAVADAVAREILQGGPAPVVGLGANGTRRVPRLGPAPARRGGGYSSLPGPGSVSRLGPGSVVVATGGARGVTAAALLALARRCQPRLVLLGRTPLAEEPPELAEAADEPALIRLLARRGHAGTGPGEGSPGQGTPAGLRARARAVLAAREVRATLAALDQAGSPVRYIPVDVRDGEAVAAALRDVRRDWGPVHGFVHGAGTLADKLIADKTEDGFARVFDTKVRGLRGMLAALADDPLEVICLFSSVAGWFGNAGQCDYAMANATLDQVAGACRTARPDCLVRSVAWGPWAGGMVGPLLAEVLARRGVPSMPVAQGAAAFVDEITGPDAGPRVLITAGDPERADPPPGRARMLGQLSVRARTHPWLADHSPAGTAVLPLAMGLDWLARGARAYLDGGAFRGGDAGAGDGDRAGDGGMALHDLRMLRKILLPRLAGPGHRFLVSATPTGPDGTSETSGTAGAAGIVLRVDGEDGAPHYQARLVPGEPMPAVTSPWPTPPGLIDYASLGLADRDRIYNDDALFHGPRFQAIVWLKGIGEQGAEGTVVGVRELDWGRDDWYFDVAALDGGMQLAGLWAWQTLGRALPVAVREGRIHRRGLVPGPVRSVVTSRGINGIHACCDVAVLDDDGAPRIELLGVELLLRPDRMPSA